ncbi:unnamed protein product [marine sediment metagenome]|uniref:Uncharacterized protein n=1 Tax=marine sediment metagenome TaxID=412755 RepID=X1J8Y9_9ZZZZ
MNKIIWTEKELEEVMKDTMVREFPPLGHVTAATRSETEATEISLVKGTITNVIVYLPPGVRDLVWVSVSLNDSSLLRAVGGDNQYHSVLAADNIKNGDIVKVLVKNYDAEFSHTVGVRVDVKESA